jgi:hypothetical protein
MFIIQYSMDGNSVNLQKSRIEWKVFNYFWCEIYRNNYSMPDLIVRLDKNNDHNDTYDLNYNFLDNSFVSKWIDRYRFSQSRGDDISTRDQFYGLNSEWTAEKTISIINERVDQINQLVPSLIDRKVNDINDQDTLNYLHSFFERYHGKVDAWLSDPWWQDKPRELRPIWSDLNNYIHRLEGYRNGNPTPRIKVCWYDTPKIKTFDPEDYALFETGHRFGYMYSLYADVGKDIRSLAYDEDDHHLDFVPPTYYSADFHLRFQTESQEKINEVETRCRSFYNQNSNYFISKGFDADDPRLVMGSIPISKLDYDGDQDQLLKDLGNYNRIQGVYLV